MVFRTVSYSDRLWLYYLVSASNVPTTGLLKGCSNQVRAVRLGDDPTLDRLGVPLKTSPDQCVLPPQTSRIVYNIQGNPVVRHFVIRRKFRHAKRQVFISTCQRPVDARASSRPSIPAGSLVVESESLHQAERPLGTVDIRPKKY
jgi:hypothetical protein